MIEEQFKDTIKVKNYLYKAQRMTDGKEVIGALLHIPNSPFTYIATIEAMENMSVDELDSGKTTNLELTRVMEKSVQKFYGEEFSPYYGEPYRGNLRHGIISKLSGCDKEEVCKSIDISVKDLDHFLSGQGGKIPLLKLERLCLLLGLNKEDFHPGYFRE